MTLASGVSISDTLNLCLNGHTITINGSESSSNPNVWHNAFDVYYGTNRGVLNIYDCKENPGKITSKADSNGPLNSGVYLENGEFHLYGGEITGTRQGITAVDNAASVYIHGGKLYGNEIAIKSNQNVYISGGEIYSNTIGVELPEAQNVERSLPATADSKHAGGNSNAPKAIATNLTMTGGTIRNNATGIAINAYGLTASVSGGTITDNNVGVSVSSSAEDSSLYLSGAPRITGNTTANVSLARGKRILIEGALATTQTTGAAVGITMLGGPGDFTDGWNDSMGNTNPAAVFSSDNSQFYVKRNGSEAALEPYLFVTYDNNRRNDETLFYEGFEGDAIPTGWTESGDWYIDSSDHNDSAPVYAGSDSLYIDGGSNGNVYRVVLPVQDLSAYRDVVLSLAYATSEWGGDINKFRLEYCLDGIAGGDVDSFTWIPLTGDVSSNDWTTLEVVLPAAAMAQNVRISLTTTDGYGYCTAIDEVKLTYPGAVHASSADPNPYTSGSQVTVRANSFTAPEGLDFGGWNTKADGTGTPYAPDDTFNITANTTLYAQWGHIHATGTPGAGITFLPWTSTDSLPTTAGSYVLTADVSLSATWSVPTGETNLCLCGHGITLSGASGSVVKVPSGASLNLYDCEPDAAHSGLSFVNPVNETETLTVTGGYITGGAASNDGAGVDVNQGSFTMYGGTIVGNNATDQRTGGGVGVASGSFTMHGGKITGNKSSSGYATPGGVFVGPNSTFLMDGGEISNNYSCTGGGGVYVYGGSFTLENGRIFGNAAQTGGGVYQGNGTTFTMNSGEISGNYAYPVLISGQSYGGLGGGVYSDGTFNLNGGEISANSAAGIAGGVFMYSGSFTLSGTPMVANNTLGSGEISNLNLRTPTVLVTVTGALTSGSESPALGVTLVASDNDPTPLTGVFTTGWPGKMTVNETVANPGLYFFSDNPEYIVALSEGNEATLVPAFAEPPVVNGPEDLTVTYGAVDNNSISVSAIAATGHTLTYQWYSNTTDSNTNGALITGATSDTYVIPSDQGHGTYYYYCVVTSTRDLGGQTNSVASDSVTVTVEKKAASIVPNPATMEYHDAAEPTLTATVTGTVNNETLEYTLNREPGTTAGTYAISVSLTENSAVNANYDITYNATAIFTINKHNNEANCTGAKLPTAHNWTYDRGVYPLLYAPTEDLEGTASLEYSLDGNTWTSEIPTATHAGTYDVQVRYNGDQNHVTFTKTVTVVVSPKVVTPEIYVDGVNNIYSGEAHTPNVVVLDLTDDYYIIPAENYTLTYSNNVNAGKATIHVESVPGADYVINTDGFFWIIRYQMTITVDANQGKVYGAAEPTLTATVSSLPTAGVNPVYTVTRAAGEDAGQYAITVNAPQSSNQNYEITLVPGTFTITPAPLTIRADNKSVVYGDPEAALTATVTGKPAGDNIAEPVYTLSREAGTDVGEYAITVTAEAAANPNYTLTLEDGTYTITQKSITVTADPKSKTYGDADPELTYTVTGLAAGDSLTGALTRAEGQNVGTYAITQGTLSAGSNYSITFNGANFTINKKSVTVTVDAGQGKTYGETDPELTYTSSGLVGSDAFTGALTRAEGQDVGVYAITQGTLTAGDNYEISFTGANFTISKKAVTLTVDADQGKSYGDADPTLTATAVGLVGSDTLNYTISREEGQDVGEYAVTITLGSNPNYEVTVTNGAFTITQRTITITADDLGKTYGENDPILTATIDSPITVGVGPVYTVSRAEGSDVGTYTITVTANAEDNPNYSITTEPGTFTISKKAATVTVDANQGKVYGQEDPTLTATVTGTVGSDTLNYTLSRASGNDAGEYAITVTLGENPNYEVTTVPGTFIIAAADVTVTVDANQGKTYGDADPTLTATVTGGLPGDTINYTLSREEGDNVGTYAITVTPGSNPNYTVSTVPGTFTISQRTITIKADDKSKTYGDADPTLTATVTGKPDDGADPVYTVSRAAGSNVGEYTITVTVVAANNPNYSITTETGTFTISQRTITVKADDKSKTYGETDPALTATVTGLVGSDTVTYTLSREEGENVGTYDITPSGAATQGNYSVEFETGTFTIDKLHVTPTVFVDAGVVYRYNGEEHRPNVRVYYGTSPRVLIPATEYETVRYENNVNASNVATGSVAAVFITPTANSNYYFDTPSNDNVASGVFYIERALVTVTVDPDQCKYIGEDDPAFTATAKLTEFPEHVGLYGNDTVNYSITRATGEDIGTYAMTVSGDTYQGNYEVTFVNDPVVNFTIKMIPVTVTITGNTSTVNYDGTEHTVTGFTAEADTELYDVEGDDKYFTFNGTATASQTTVGTASMGLDKDQFVNNNPIFDVTFVVASDGSQTVSARPVTVTITGSSNTAAYDGTAHTVTGYDVSIGDSLYTQADFSFSGNATATRTDAGTTSMGLAASQFTNNNGNFDVTFSVTDGGQTIEAVDDEITVTITGHTSTVTYDGQAHTVTGYDFSSDNTLFTESMMSFTGTASASQTNAGTANMGLAASQFSSNSPNFTNVTFQVTDGSQTVNVRPVTVNITGNSYTGTYDGTEHTATGYTVSYTDSLFAESMISFSGTASAAQTDAGTANMNLAASQFSCTNSNFDVTFNVTDGYATVNAITDAVTVTITGSSNTSTYDGQSHSVSGYSFNADNSLYVESFMSFSGTASASRTDAGTTNMGLAQGQFSNNTGNFTNVTFQVTDGYQTINPLDVTVTVTGSSDTSTYDGQSHTVSGYTANANSNLYDVDSNVTFSGTATASRTDAGTTNMGLAQAQFANTNPNFNVTFNVTDGYQTIETVDDEITVTITGSTSTVTYDGQAHSVSGYTFSSDNDLYTESLVSFSGTASASRTDAGTTNMGLAQGQFSNTSPNFTNVTFQVTDGYQTINRLDVTVTVTGSSDTSTYDGQSHTVSGYTANANSNLYDVDSNVTFSGTATASRTDAGTTNMGLAQAQFANTNPNFNVTFNVTDGYQTIEAVDDEITVTITGHTSTVTYDGQAHSVSGYTFSSDNDLYTESLVSFSGTASASRTDAGTTNMGLAQGQFSNTSPNFTNVTFQVTDGYQTINARPVTVTITGNSYTGSYDGAAHTATGYTAATTDTLYVVTGDNKDFTFNGTATATRTDAGTTNMGLLASQFANTNNNFNVTFSVTDGYATVNAITDAVTVTITGHNNTTAYDGQEHTVSGYDFSSSNTLFTESFVNFTATATATRTDAGTTNMGLAASQFSNNTGNFTNVTFNVTDGYQTITAIDVTVTITGNSYTGSYDGAAHTATGYTAEASSTLYNVNADFTFTGTATATRTDAGTTNMGLQVSQFANTNPNFATVTFNVTDGYVTINPIDVTVTVTGDTCTEDYDGAAHTATGYTAEASSSLYNVNADFTFTGTATATRTDAGTTNMGLLASQFANTNPNFATVTFNVTDGYVTINPLEVEVTITGQTNTATYDRQPHTVTGFTVAADKALYDVEGDDKYFTFTGTATATRTDAGTTNMGLLASQFTNNNSNFDVTFTVTDGWQKVEPKVVNPALIMIVGGAITYNGQAQEPGIKVYDGEDLIPDSEYTAVFGNNVNAGTADISLTNVEGNYVVGGSTTFLIWPAPVTVTVASDSKTYGDADPTWSATVTGGVTGETINYTLTREPGQNVGTYAINAVLGENSNFAVTTVPGTFTINPKTATVKANDLTKVYGEADPAFTVTVDGLVAGDDASQFQWTAERAPGNDVGTYTITVSGDEYQGNYQLSYQTGTLTITQKTGVVVTITGHSDSSVYNGEAHNITGYDVSISDQAYTEADFTFSGTASATRTNVGTTAMGLDASQFINNNPNFNVTFNVTDGGQTVTKLAVDVTITGHNSTLPYDGQPHTVTGYDFNASSTLYAAANVSLTGEATATQTDAGTAAMGLTEERFSNTNDNFDVTFTVTDGWQTVEPIDVTVTVTGHSGTYPYDGQAHSASGYDLSFSNDLYTANHFSFSGNAQASQTNAGTAAMGLEAGQFVNTSSNFANVTFNVTDGYVTVEPIDVTVTVTGHSGTYPYDGTAHTVTGYDLSFSSNLYTEADFEFFGEAAATQTNAGTARMIMLERMFRNVNPNFANVTFNVTQGYVTVTPIDVTVTVTGHSTTAVYDGQEHNARGYDVEIGNSLYHVSDFSFSGDAYAARTDAGTTAMGLTAEQFTNNNPNFGTVTFNVTDGFVTIDSNATLVVTITGHTETVTYDGQAHSVSGYEFSSSDGLYAAGDFTFSGSAQASQTNVGTASMGLEAGQFTNTNANYSNVTFVVASDGFVTVNPVENVTVTITGHTATATYDGQAHSASGYDFQASNDLFTAADLSFSGEAQASQTAAGTAYMGLNTDQFTNTNPNFANVNLNVTDGYVTVNPVVTSVIVTITGHSTTATYDGQAHSASGYDVSISNDLYTAADFSFSGEAQASQTNAGTAYMGLNASQFTNNNGSFANVVFNVIDGSVTVNPLENVVVTVTGHTATATYDGQAHSASGYDVDISNSLYTVADFSFSGNAHASQTDAGTANMGLNASQFTNTNPNFANVTFNVTDGCVTVNPVENVTVTITGHTATATYDGQAHSVSGYDFQADNALYTAEDFIFSGNAQVSRTDAGTSYMGLRPVQFRNVNPNFGNVTFNVTDGNVTVTPLETVVVTITGHTATATYDAQAHFASGYEVSINSELYHLSDFGFSGQAYAARTDAGTTVMGLTAEQFSNNNPNFANVTFTVTDGSVTVNALENVVVTITGHTATATYDGTAHTASGYDVSISSPLYTAADFTFSGEAQASQTNAGTAYMGLNAEQFANTNPNFANVTFNVTDGYVTVNALETVVVTITGHTATATYDGTAHTASGYDVSISSPLYTAADFSFSGEAQASQTNAGTAYMGLNASQFTNDNPNFANVTFNVTDGYVTVNTLETVVVTITGHTATATYDGTAHSASGYDVSISNDLYTAADFSFSGEAQASQTNAGTANMGLNASQFTNTNPNFANVTFNVTDGYVTVNALENVVVTITGHTATATYDGQAHSVSGYDFQADNALYTAEDFIFSGNAQVSRTDAGTSYMGLLPVQFRNTSPNFTNVTFEVTDGYITVTPLETVVVTITGHTATAVYNGQAHSAHGYEVSISSELYHLSDFTLEGEAYVERTEAGTSAMGLTADRFSNDNPNFANVTFQVTDGFVTVTRRPVTVAADAASKVFGEEDPVLTATVTGLVEGETLNYSLSRGFGFNAGEYAITVTLGDNANYDVTAENGVFTILKKDASITLGEYVKTYGEEDPAMTAEVTGTVPYDNLNYSLVRDEGEDVGEYEIRVELGENPNYVVTTVSGVLYINFVDVPENSYFFDAVRWGILNGITAGTDKAHFSPQIGITRAQAVTFLWRLAGSPEPTITECVFTDVSENAYYYKAVLWGNETGVTVGTTETTFSPNMICTRAHIMTFLWRYAGSPEPAGACPFKDIKPGAYYEKPATWAYENGVSSGTGKDTFSPHRDCTRAEMAVFLWAFSKIS